MGNVLKIKYMFIIVDAVNCDENDVFRNNIVLPAQGEGKVKKKQR